jgi:hypothetical protein
MEFGFRPPASPSCRLYPPGRSPCPLRDGVEPEAIGAYAYAPAGKQKIKAKSIAHRAEVFEFGNRNGECGKWEGIITKFEYDCVI